MAVNKVEFGDQVVMDITDSTVSPEKLLSGETAYDRSGAKITGSLVTKDISIETKRSTGENVATISLDNTDYDIYAISEDEVSDLISGEQEETGNPVVLKTLIGGNAKSCSVDLLPIQDLHGYNSPWVGGAGKNKCPIRESGAPGNIYNVGYLLPVSNGDTVYCYFEYTYSDSANLFGALFSNASETNKNNGTNLGTFQSGTVKRFDITSSGYFGVCYSSGVATYTITKAMISKSNITQYEPYENICPISGRTEVNLTVADAETSPTQTETYTETLGQTVYGGKVDFVSGKLTIEYEYKKITRTAEPYKYSGMNGVSFASTLDGSKTRSVGYCSHAKVVTDTFDTQEGDMWFGVGNSRVYWVGILDAMQMTLAEFQTYMSNNDVYIAYPLNTPTEITLTAEQIALLKGNNVVSTDGDNIDITWQNIPDIEDITPIKPLDYSTSEQATGQKWIDGSDIYRRTFTGTIDSNTHGTTEIADFTDLQPIACNGWFMDTSGVGMALGYFPNSTSWASALHIDSNHKLILFTESALAAGTYYVTVDYIKTS